MEPRKIGISQGKSTSRSPRLRPYTPMHAPLKNFFLTQKTKTTQKHTQIKRKIKKSEKNGAEAPFFSLFLIFLLIWVGFWIFWVILWTICKGK